MLDERTLTIRELADLQTGRFGDSPRRWKFRCPGCGDIATIEDFEKALADHPRTGEDGKPVSPSELFGTECIGRTLGALQAPNPQAWKASGGRGCTVAASHTVRGTCIVLAPDDGHGERSIYAFPVADPDPAQIVHIGSAPAPGIEGTRVYRVKDGHSTWGRSGPPVIIRRLRLPITCGLKLEDGTTCTGERGMPFNHNGYEDGEHYSCDRWTNSCGHTDYYEVLLKAAGII